jgi:hypothetical protein
LPILPVAQPPQAPPPPQGNNAPPPMPIINNINLPNLNSPGIPVLVPINILIKIPKPKTPDEDEPPAKPKKPAKKAPKKELANAPVAATEASQAARQPQPLAPLPGLFQFSMDCGNGLCNETNEFEMITGRGTLYSLESSRSVNLAMGHMVVIAGNVEVSFKAGRLNARIAPGCAMAADVMSDGTTKLYSLPAFEETHSDSMVEVPSELGGQSVPLPAGQELVLSNRMLNQEELIATDGADISPVEAGLTLKSDGRLHLVRYSTKRMQQNQILIGCRTVTIPPTERLNKVREAISRSAQNEATAGTEDNQPTNLKPVALSQPAATNSVRQAGDLVINDKQATVFATNGTIADWQDETGKAELIKGSLLIHSHNNITVKAFGAAVRIHKGAIALVKVESHFLKVVNLTDMASRSVTISVGNDSLALLPGRELILSERAPNLSYIFDLHQIGHRTIISRQIGERIWATTSEVALADELIHQPLLRWIRFQHISSGQPLVNQIVKTAAALQTIMHQSEYVRGETDDEIESSQALARGCATCSH